MRVSWVWIYEDNAEVNVPNSILRRRAHGRDEDEVDAVQSGGPGGGREEVRISVFSLRLHAWGIAAKCRFSQLVRHRERRARGAATEAE